MRSTELKELQGASRISLGFINSLIRRIECTKPLAGTGISITQEDNGYKINFGASSKALNEKKINVCSGGVPVSITVYGP
jgi:hypothetical protein